MPDCEEAPGCGWKVEGLSRRAERCKMATGTGGWRKARKSVSEVKEKHGMSLQESVSS